MPEFDFTPIGDRVVVKTQDETDGEQTSKSGIVYVVRDTVNKEIPQCGEVVAVGVGGTFPDCPDPSKVFSVGDFIYFNRYAGEEIMTGDPLDKTKQQKYTVLRLDAIFGKLNKAKPSGK